MSAVRTIRPGVAVVALMLAGCAGPLPQAGLACRGHGAPAEVFTLFFGRSMPNGTVSDAAWRSFEDQVIVPALPDGFTVLDASGAWMSPAGHATRHEATKVLVVALPARPGAAEPVERIRQAYQQQFHQELVGMTMQPGCASF